MNNHLLTENFLNLIWEANYCNTRRRGSFPRVKWQGGHVRKGKLVRLLLAHLEKVQLFAIPCNSGGDIVIYHLGAWPHRCNFWVLTTHLFPLISHQLSRHSIRVKLPLPSLCPPSPLTRLQSEPLPMDSAPAPHRIQVACRNQGERIVS